VDANPQAKPAALLLGHPAHTRDAGRDAMCIQESHSERQGQCCGRPRTPYTVRKPGRTVASGVPELVRGGSSARCFTFPLLTPHLPTCCASPPLCGPTVVLKTALQRNVWGENMSSKVYHEILQVRTLYSKNSPMSSWFGRRQEARSPERVFWPSAPHAVRLAAWVCARAMGLAARADTGVCTAGGVGGFPERHPDSGYALVSWANSFFPPPSLAHPSAAQRAQQHTF